MKPLRMKTSTEPQTRKSPLRCGTYEPADIVVVGAGAAGCALAARLSEDPDRRVLLLEAGRVPCGEGEFGPDLLDARHVPGARPGHPAVSTYDVLLTPGRPSRVPRGRILGGSTTVNGGYFVRARRQDFDDWAAAGNPAWAYEEVLPFLRTLETDLDHDASQLHGTQGPVPVRRSLPHHPAAAAFHASALALGHAPDPDKNAQARPGIGPVPCNIVDGIRRNAALSYLPAEVLNRPNLTVVGGCTAERVTVEHGRATGVVVRHSGTEVRLTAGEVVLCAGALETALLLLRSGVGPRADLERLGIPVVRDAPAVGTRFGDHPELVLEWQPLEDLGALPEGTSWLGECLHHQLDDGQAEVEILQSLIPLSALASGTPGEPGAPLSFLVSDLTPRPTGRLRLAPDGSTVIDHGYLSTPDAFRPLRHVARLTAELLCAGPLAGLAGTGLLAPSPGVLEDDTLLDDWIRRNLATAHHTCGTVPMGPPDDPGRAAADQFGRVHGVRGLRVADTSLLPSAPRRGTANTAVLVGELIAHAIRVGR